ncbi:hypothetical protein cypCar_00017095 [Cyprinus carpio]|nr:hypothetical protein cypCar_00017095 [Cyprinus carpio]
MIFLENRAQFNCSEQTRDSCTTITKQKDSRGSSAPVEVPVIGLSVPVMWLYLLMNVVTQYVCIRGVFILTTECASLTVTLVVTLRKFLSLIISILYFHNPFTAWHWVGTAVVFLGTLLYTEVWSSVRAAIKGEKVDKKAE